VTDDLKTAMSKTKEHTGKVITDKKRNMFVAASEDDNYNLKKKKKKVRFQLMPCDYKELTECTCADLKLDMYYGPWNKPYWIPKLQRRSEYPISQAHAICREHDDNQIFKDKFWTKAHIYSLTTYNIADDIFIRRCIDCKVSKEYNVCTFRMLMYMLKSKISKHHDSMKGINECKGNCMYSKRLQALKIDALEKLKKHQSKYIVRYDVDDDNS
jgi:hypothetical protein